MRAFCKRRCLLSLLGVLALSTCFMFYRRELTSSEPRVSTSGGLADGAIFFRRMEGYIGYLTHIANGAGNEYRFKFHRPAIKLDPPFTMRRAKGYFYIEVPLWTLIAVVIAWIALREWRWRERRARAKEEQT
jgi:hypothetical protein